MLIDTEEYIKTLAKYDINEKELLILKLLDDNDIENIELYKKLVGGFDLNSVDNLMKKNLIIRSNDGLYDINIDLTINNVDLDILPEEIWKRYPSWLLINNNRVSAKSTDYDWFSNYYLKKIIKGSRRKHKVILQTINNYESENGGYATMGIEKFFKSRHYEELLGKTTENNTQYGSEQF